MDIYMLRTFFMWCTIINGGLLCLSFLMFVIGGDFVYRMHSRWYPIPRESFNLAMYSIMGFYKIIVLVFNIVPFIVLAIMQLK